MAILSLCDLTGNAVRPWADAGHKCYCIDIQHERKRTEGNITFLPYDVLKLANDGAPLVDWIDWDFVFAWPPCTDLAVSGARWFKEKGLGRLVKALAIVEACKQITSHIGAPWMLENPVGTISSYWRKPDYTFHPHEFGGYAGGADDDYTKKTCLWTGEGFVMPERRPIPVNPKTGNRIHMAAPSEDRANIRSATPVGFSQAVYEANNGIESEQEEATTETETLLF